MRTLTHITMTGVMLPFLGLGFYSGMSSGNPAAFFYSFLLFPTILLEVWPWLLVSVAGTAAICSLMTWVSWHRLSTWFFCAIILGAAYGAMIAKVMALREPWYATAAALLAAAIGAYPLHQLWTTKSEVRSTPAARTC